MISCAPSAPHPPGLLPSRPTSTPLHPNPLSQMPYAGGFVRLLVSQGGRQVGVCSALRAPDWPLQPRSGCTSRVGRCVTERQSPHCSSALILLFAGLVLVAAAEDVLRLGAAAKGQVILACCDVYEPTREVRVLVSGVACHLPASPMDFWACRPAALLLLACCSTQLIRPKHPRGRACALPEVEKDVLANKRREIPGGCLCPWRPSGSQWCDPARSASAKSTSLTAVRLHALHE